MSFNLIFFEVFTIDHPCKYVFHQPNLFGNPYEEDEAGMTKQELISRAEERVKVAHEMATNNSRARANLIVKKIIKKSAIDIETQADISTQDREISVDF